MIHRPENIKFTVTGAVVKRYIDAVMSPAYAPIEVHVPGWHGMALVTDVKARTVVGWDYDVTVRPTGPPFHSTCDYTITNVYPDASESPIKIYPPMIPPNTLQKGDTIRIRPPQRFNLTDCIVEKFFQ